MCGGGLSTRLPPSFSSLSLATFDCYVVVVVVVVVVNNDNDKEDNGIILSGISVVVGIDKSRRAVAVAKPSP